jgi:hypothetical protein
MGPTKVNLNLVPILSAIVNGPAHYAENHHLSPLPTSAIVIGAFAAELSACTEADC